MHRRSTNRAWGRAAILGLALLSAAISPALAEIAPEEKLAAYLRDCEALRQKSVAVLQKKIAAAKANAQTPPKSLDRDLQTAFAKLTELQRGNPPLLPIDELERGQYGTLQSAVVVQVIDEHTVLIDAVYARPIATPIDRIRLATPGNTVTHRVPTRVQLWLEEFDARKLVRESSLSTAGHVVEVLGSRTVTERSGVGRTVARIRFISQEELDAGWERIRKPVAK